MTESTLRIRVFGGLRVWRDDIELDLGPPRQRVVLAELLAARGQPVGFELLVDALWTGDSPTTAANQVHRHIGQLRRLFEPQLPVRASGRWLLSAGTAYRFVVAGEASYDLARLDDLREQARRAATHSPDTALELYLAALAIAQRPAFADLESSVLQRPEFVALEQARMNLAVQVADLALEQQRGEEVLPALQAIAESAPWNEAVQARVIRTLTATGRRPEALIVYDRVRRRLSEELGVYPGAEIRSAYQGAVADPDGDAPSVETPAEAASAPAHRPAQLPSTVLGFVDRVELNEALAQCLLDLDRGGAVVITALGGMGGIGKTALAVAWAHRIADRFPDGQLYLNLRGFDPDDRAVEPGEALRSLLQGLDPSSLAMPDEDVDQRAARFRSAMAGRRMIVLLDNARDARQVRPLLPAAAGCLVIVTSRNRLTGLVTREGARAVSVGRLPNGEARELLTRRLGAAYVAADPMAMESVIAACAGLPLALSIAAARAATVDSSSLADIARELAAETGLDALATDDADDDLRSVFSWSYRTISPHGQQLFRLLGVHPGPEISLRWAASIADDSLSATRIAARELASANLLTEVATDRYAMHDLLRAYAAELLAEGGQREPAERRLVNHCLHSARAAYLQYGRPALVDIEAPGAGLHPDQPGDVSEAVAWYLEHRALLAMVMRLAITREWYRAAAVISLELRPMSESSGTPGELLNESLEILGVLYRIDEPVLTADAERYVGAKYNRMGDHVRADNHFRRAREQFRAIGDLTGEAHTLRNLANGIITGRDPDESLEYSRLAAEAASRAARDDVLAVILTDRVGMLAFLGRWDQVIGEGQNALERSRAAGVGYLEAAALGQLAEAHRRLGDYAKSVDYAEQSLACVKQNPDIDVEIEALGLLAQSAFAIGDRERAHDACSRFYALRDSFDGSAARGSYTPELRATIDAIHSALGEAGS